MRSNWSERNPAKAGSSNTFGKIWVVHVVVPQIACIMCKRSNWSEKNPAKAGSSTAYGKIWMVHVVVPQIECKVVCIC
jgi:hypothetical protein